MAIGPEQQESGNASSYPNYALTPPLTIQQQLQSIVVAMVNLTQQNEELTREVIDTVDSDVMRNIGKIQRMEGQRTVLREEISPEVTSLVGYHTWKERWIK